MPAFRIFEVLDENDRYAFIDCIRNDIDLISLKKRLKKELVSSAMEKEAGMLSEFLRCADIVREENREPEELSADPWFIKAYHKYRTNLERRRLFDFSELVSRAASLVEAGSTNGENSSLSLKHVSVDEYQDINPGQEQLIRSLAHHGAAVCAVGDDDQSIYGWRGADISNIISFSERYPDVYTHSLDVNYRSTDLVVRTAAACIERNDSRLEKTIQSSGRQGRTGDIYSGEFEYPKEEAAFIVNRIHTLLGTEYTEHDGSVRGLTYSDIALFFRSVTFDSKPYLESLEAAGIPYNTGVSRGLLYTPEAGAVFCTLCCLGKVPHPGKTVPVMEDIIRSIPDGFPSADPETVNRFLENIEGKLSKGTQISLQQLFLEFLNACGVCSIHDEEFTELNTAMTRLGMFSSIISSYEKVYGFIHNLYDLSDFCWFIKKYISRMERNLETEHSCSAENAVQVLTLHAAKGLSFPAVFMPKSIDRSRETDSPFFLEEDRLDISRYLESEESQRRLFYVGLTRSEQYLHTTAPRNDGNGNTLAPSPFLSELSAECVLSPEMDDPAVRTKREQSARADVEERAISSHELKDAILCGQMHMLKYGYGFKPPIVPPLGYTKGITAVADLVLEKLRIQGVPPSDGDIRFLCEKHLYFPYAGRVLEKKLKESAQDRITALMRFLKENSRLSDTKQERVQISSEGLNIKDQLRYSDAGKQSILNFEIPGHADETGVQDPEDIKTVLAVFYSEHLETISGRHILEMGKSGCMEKKERITSKIRKQALKKIAHAAQDIKERSADRRSCNASLCRRCDFRHVCPRASGGIKGTLKRFLSRF